MKKSIQIVSLTILFIISLNLFAQNQVCFSSAVQYTFGSVAPADIVSEDFNGDGFQDIVSTNYNASSVTIRLNNGSGSFLSPTDFITASGPNGIVAADFNADGNLDLAIGCQSNSNISVLLGNGLGAFAPAINYNTGSLPKDIVSADFNGDNKLDLATVNYNSNDVSVLIGDGFGSFSPPSAYAVGTNPASIITADFNNDGTTDLAVTNNWSDNISVLIATGSGTFLTAVNYATGTRPRSITSADFNEDGYLDIATCNAVSNSLSIFSGNGIGGFSAAISINSIINPGHITSNDFDSDGHMDLALCLINSNQVLVLPGDGLGNFLNTFLFAVGTYPLPILGADFNNDGNPDIATANQTSSDISILLNTIPNFSNSVIIDVSCYGANNGAITVIPSGGTPPYSYSWGLVPAQTTATITNLFAGDYTVLVSANGCSKFGNFTIHEPYPIDVAVYASDSIITANNPNGTYQWINCDNGNGWLVNENNQNYTATVTGNYAVIINENGCADTSVCTSITVVQPCEPNQPGQISGNTSVTAGTTETYSVIPVAGATSYIWTLPSGWSGSSSSNSINTTAGASSGTISVSAINSCGSSAPSTLAVVSSSGQTSNCTPALFKDLRPGFLDSYPENFRELNGTLYFSNNDGLWKTNGTEVGTTQIESFSDLKEIEVLNNNLIFCVPSPNWQLWKSDGTNTTLIKEFPNASSFDGIFNLTPANGFVFFTVNENYVRKLWRTDGTEAGTILVKDIDPTNYASYSPGGYFEFNNNVYFNAGTSTTGQELWKSDGTEAGTTIVKDIRPGVASGHTNYGVYAILNNELYFYASDGVQYGLWKTDGSDAGTVFIKECIWIGEISTINNVLYFSAYDIGANTGNTLYGEELWRSDGTPSGTYMVKDINPGQNGSKHNDYQFKAINSTIVFSAKDGINGVELWKTDGTEAGTMLLKNIDPDVINAQIGLSSSKVLNGYLYFSANNGTTGGELWKTDGTEAGTALVADLYPGSDGSSPFGFTVFNGNIFFRAESESAGVELWSCVAATSSVADDVELDNSISVYPNPSSDFITIENKSGKLNSAYVIFNSYGQQVLRGELIAETTTVDVSVLKSGFYTLQIGGLKQRVFKLIKK